MSSKGGEGSVPTPRRAGRCPYIARGRLVGLEVVVRCVSAVSVVVVVVVVVVVACSGSSPPGKGGASDESAVDSGTPEAEIWRSSLYPLDWAPGFSTEDGQLRDFSHAGYGGGDVDLPTVDLSAVISVVEHGADPSGGSDSTLAIQAAIDSAPPDDSRHVVHFPEGLYRVDGALVVQRSNTVLVGDGSERTQLWFTAAEGVGHTSHLRFLGQPTGSAPAAILDDISLGDDVVAVALDAPYTVGDEVWLGIDITEDFVSDHGMDGYWTFSLGAWRPFFRRTVVDVVEEGDRLGLKLDVSLPYPLATRHGLRIEKVDGQLREVGLVGVAVSDAADWDAAWANNQVHAVSFEGVKDAWVQDLVSFAGPGADGHHHLQSGGVLVRDSRRVTLADLHLANPQNRGDSGNGYLVDLRTSNQVLVRDTVAENGRHNLIQNWDFGASDLVFLRTHSAGAESFTSSTDTRGLTACSETHHALAIAVLVDHSTVDDCWKMVNRLSYSSGAGHTATESVFWNLQGSGVLTSHQYGRGYVVGTDLSDVVTEVLDIYESFGTAPEDFVEGTGEAATLDPPSLYEDQLARRLAR